MGTTCEHWYPAPAWGQHSLCQESWGGDTMPAMASVQLPFYRLPGWEFQDVDLPWVWMSACCEAHAELEGIACETAFSRRACIFFAWRNAISQSLSRGQQHSKHLCLPQEKQVGLNTTFPIQKTNKQKSMLPFAIPINSPRPKWWDLLASE